MTLDEAAEIVSSMLARREDRAIMEREAARQMRAYAWGLRTAQQRTMAIEIADQHEASAARSERVCTALKLIMEDVHGRRECEADQGRDAAESDGSVDRSAIRF